jgi:hypothetical protein
MKRSRRSISSPELAEDSSQTLFSGMSPSAPSNGTPTVAKSSENEPPRGGSRTCKCSRETFGCSMHPIGRDEWIASMRGSLASLTPLLENARARMMTETSGLRPQESLGKFDQNGVFLKTSRDLFQTGSSEPSSVIWPASGMMRDGRCWGLTRLVPRTAGTDGGVWPTPNTEGYRSDGELAILAKSAKSHQEFLQMSNRATRTKREKYWPTPTTQDAANNGSPSQMKRHSKPLNAVVGWALNPTWVEILMGWPEDWTELRRSIVPRQKTVLEKPCDTCGKAMGRKRYNGRLEDYQVFKRRRHCSLSCANTREVVGYHGQSWRARQHLGKSCERCGKIEYLAAHHMDEDRSNNTQKNIQTLCASCHAWWHHEAKRRGIRPSGRAESIA